MTDETVEVTDASIFQEAIAKDPPKEKAEAAPTESGTNGEQPRDERGRFAPLKAEAVGEAHIETPPVTPAREEQKENTDHHIPAWRLREEADARREADRRAQQLEQMLAQYEARIRELNPPQQPELPDFFANPEALPAYFEHMLAQREQHWQQNFRQAVANMSLQRAHDRHGELFLEAFKNITDLPLSNPIRQQVINSPDPGETLVKLYRDQKNLSMIGDEGIDAFMQKKLEAALDDPAFLAKAIERAKGVAGTQPTQQIRTPPSLNKATGARVADDAMEVTDEGIYKYARG